MWERAVPSADSGQRQLENKAAAELVKQRDRDRYWSALFAPARLQPGLHALYAYNAELAHIAAAAKEPMVAQIRLQWWRDAVDLAAPDTKTGNPVADALSTAIEEHGLPKESLIAMADARIPEVFGDLPASLQALQASLCAIYAPVFELAAAILGSRSETCKAAAQHAGFAYGMTQTLRTVPLQASRGRLLLPPSFLEGRGIDLGAVYRGKASAAFGAALADLREGADRALQHFRALAQELDPAAFAAFLPLALVEPYLKAMAAPGLNPLQTPVTLNPVRRFWRIWHAARRGRI
jgi:phytoene synthase